MCSSTPGKLRSYLESRISLSRLPRFRQWLPYDRPGRYAYVSCVLPIMVNLQAAMVVVMLRDAIRLTEVWKSAHLFV